MNAPVGTDRVNERRAVGAAQLFDFAVSQDERHDRVLVLDGFETPGVGRVTRLNLLHRRETELVKEHGLELLG